MFVIWVCLGFQFIICIFFSLEKPFETPMCACDTETAHSNEFKLLTKWTTILRGYFH